MKRQPKNYSPQQEIAILKKNSLESVPISCLCKRLGLHPTKFHRWKRSLLEGEVPAFQKESSRKVARLKCQIGAL